jgi:hypothetical protein
VVFGASFAAAPTVLSQIQTFNGPDWALTITDNPTGVSFSQSFTDPPALIAKISSFDGPDPANLRFSSLTGSGFTAIAAEEQSLDSELIHTTGRASYLALEGAAGTIEAFAV